MKRKTNATVTIIASLVVLTVIIAMSCLSCKNGKPAEASLSADKKTVSVGDKIVVTVSMENCPDAKTVGYEVVYDHDCFDLVSGEMLMKGELSDFSDGTGVVAFSKPTDVNGKILQFVLKATHPVKDEQISVTASFKDTDNKPVDIAVTPAVITVKE